MNIAVYLGSSFGKDLRIQKKTEELGKWIGSHGHTLVYGGSDSGLMGILANGVLSENGKIIGVMPEFLVQRNRAMKNLENFIMTKDMAERKKIMLEKADAYIAMPGGPGTLEEISEAISSTRLGIFAKPCIFFNINGYYDSLFAYFENMIHMGFATESDLQYVHNAKSMEDIEYILGEKHEI